LRNLLGHLLGGDARDGWMTVDDAAITSKAMLRARVRG